MTQKIDSFWRVPLCIDVVKSTTMRKFPNKDIGVFWGLGHFDKNMRENYLNFRSAWKNYYLSSK